MYSNSANRQYISTGNGVLTPATQEDVILRPLAGNYVDFFAYYPYIAGIDTTYPISLSEQLNKKQLEIFYSNNAKNITNTPRGIKFIFSRVLSKIVINTITHSLGNLENKDLYDMNITINNISNEIGRAHV